MNLTLEQMQRNLESFKERWEQEIRDRISVTVTPKQVVAETHEPPVFIHPQINLLYEYGYDIPVQHLEEIKALPRETLLKDLNAVVYDSIARYVVFEQNEWDDEHNWFLMHALLLMREIKATESLEVILDFLSQSKEFLEYWLGDMLTEDIWSVIALCGSNNLERLQSFMWEPGRYTWARSAAAETVNQLALHGIIPKQKAIDWMRDVLEYYIHNKSNPNLIDSDLNGSLIGICLDLQAQELLPLIKQMLDEKIANPNVAGDMEEVQQEMDLPMRKFAKRDIETIAQTYEDIRQRVGSDLLSEDDIDSVEPESENDEYDNYEDVTAVKPYVRSEKKLGRNDPCLCGSGRKYKKCHGMNIV